MASLYQPKDGPHPVHTDDVSKPDPVQERTVRFRLHLPAGSNSYPVIIYSHGSFCGPATYDRIAKKWAASGYAVVVPHHLDAPGDAPPAAPPDLGRLLSSRVRDLSFAVDALPELKALSDWSGEFDPARIAAGGHSFGAMTAMIKLGLKLKPGMYSLAGPVSDPRYRAVLCMSGVGLLPPMADDAFSELAVPLMASGGTLDEGNVGSGPVHPWEWRMTPYTLAPPGDKYSLVLDRADHYLGGLIGRDEAGPDADREGLAIIAAVTTAFLDAYLKEEAGALEWLGHTDLATLTNQRAILERN